MERLKRGVSLLHGRFYHVRDGLHYHINRLCRNVVYLKCVFYERGCKGRALFRADEENPGVRVFRHTQPHNHQPEPYYPQYLRARLRILKRCRKLDHRPFHVIINEESQRCHPDVRALLRTQMIKDAMWRARRSVYPPVPQTLHELSDLLRTRRYHKLTATFHGGNNLYFESVVANDGSHHVIFTSRPLLDLMKNSRVLFCDGTFKSVPAAPDAQQLCVILTTSNFNIIPLAWVLMERKTKSGYRAVLSALRQALGAHRIRKVITDWEPGMQRAWEQIFQVEVQGCFWHFCMAVIRKAKGPDLGLLWDIRNDSFVRRIIRLCIAIPLLPHKRLMRRAFLSLIRQTNRQGAFHRNLLRPFFLYMWNTWFNNRRNLRRMKFFGSFHRTNNAAESHHSWINRILKVAHPNLYDLFWALRLLEDNALNDALAIENGMTPSRRRRASAISNDRRLHNLGYALYHGIGPRDVAVLRFLHHAVKCFQKVFNQNFFDF